MTTDTSESGLESLICRALTGQPCNADGAGALRDRPAAYGAGWICGDGQEYDREHCVDLAQLSAFLYTDLFKQFSDNGSFRRWLLESSFRATYDRIAGAGG